MNTLIVIVGRPNVGKSTLFNRLTRSRAALVDGEPGITRDRLYASVEWESKSFTLVDTGGFDDSEEEPLLQGVRKQVVNAIEEADRIIFMVDGRDGLMPGDEKIADILRRSRKRVFLGVNKVDGTEREHLTADFYRLGFDRVYPISAAHGYGLAAFLSALTEDLAESAKEETAEDLTRVAIIGRPNVGKSSLINRIVGSERLLVSELPGTTRDSVDILFTLRGRNYVFIDTAGIRKKGRVKEKIEKFSVIKALQSLDRCHVAVILMDTAEGVTDQDAHVCGYAFERGRGVILALNKWDLVKKDPEKKKHLADTLDRQLSFLSFAPKLYVSALTGEKINKIFQEIDLLRGQLFSRTETSIVNKVLTDIVQKNPPPKMGSGRLKFLYATQTGVMPPSFAVFVNRPDLVHFSYERYMMNQLREQLGLNQVPIRIKFKKK
ncbi:MAG: ribosome biogenesis GTPase Der [Deltaproteobacteria bacterium]|nr:ribosome biogenesis GTPase Der [Deltaproteobacteria bacterium]